MVKRIFDDYVNGLTLTEIASNLNKTGSKTLQGREWKAETVKRILRNEVYVGDIRFQKKISRDVITGKPDEEQIDRYQHDHHIAIIERDIWEAAQERLQAYREKYGRSSG